MVELMVEWRAGSMAYSLETRLADGMVEQMVYKLVDSSAGKKVGWWELLMVVW